MAESHSRSHDDPVAWSRREVLQVGGAALAGVAGSLSGRPMVAQAQTPAAAPVREITPIAGPVYRFRNNFHYSIFAVTPAGIVATDPINADAAQWLKAELGRRFAQPIRYVVYSHDHADHIAGGQVFADTAVVVAHEAAKTTIVGEKRPTAVPQLTFTDQMTLELGGTAIELWGFVGMGVIFTGLALLSVLLLARPLEAESLEPTAAA